MPHRNLLKSGMDRFARMPRSTLLAIALLAPFGLLAFFALRTLGLEQDALDARNRALLETRLDATAGAVAARLELAARDEVQQASDIWTARGPEALRYFVLSGGVAYALVFRDGRRVFPPDDSDQLLLHTHGGLRVFEAPAAELRAGMPRGGSSAARLLSVGGGAFALLRCSRSVGMLDVCVVIEPAKVSTVLASALGQALTGAGSDGQRIWLATPDDQRVGGAPGTPRPASASRSLSGFLVGWRIEAEDVDVLRSRRSEAIVTFAIAAALLAGWAALTLSLHRASVDRAQSVERRSRVVALLSHELRTPLANLRLYADLVRRKADSPEVVTRYAGVLGEEIARLEQIADNAIELGRGGPDVSRREWGSPDATLSTLVDRFAPSLAAVGCTVELEAGAGTPCLYDRSAWERIIVNLLDNARKHAPGSRVAVSSSLRDGRLSLKVADDGPGIDGRLRDSIFQPLARDARSNVPGFGLGLSVVRTLARQNGGDAVIEDRSRGSAFHVTMAVEQRAATSGAAAAT